MIALAQHFVAMLCKHLDYGSLLPEYPGLASAAPWVTGSSYQEPVCFQREIE